MNNPGFRKSISISSSGEVIASIGVNSTSINQPKDAGIYKLDKNGVNIICHGDFVVLIAILSGNGKKVIFTGFHKNGQGFRDTHILDLKKSEVINLEMLKKLSKEVGNKT